MLKATKVRIYPTAEQAEFIDRQFDAVEALAFGDPYDPTIYLDRQTWNWKLNTWGDLEERQIQVG